jgi:hypothetical protein
MTLYSSDRQVNEYVTRLVSRVERNPYDPDGHGATVAGVVELACHNFGRRRSRTIQITVH